MSVTETQRRRAEEILGPLKADPSDMVRRSIGGLRGCPPRVLIEAAQRNGFSVLLIGRWITIFGSNRMVWIAGCQPVEGGL